VGALETMRRTRSGLPSPHPAGVVFDDESIVRQRDGPPPPDRTPVRSDPESAVRGVQTGRACGSSSRRPWPEAAAVGSVVPRRRHARARRRAGRGDRRLRGVAPQAQDRVGARNLALLEGHRGDRERSLSLYLEAVAERPELAGSPGVRAALIAAEDRGLAPPRCRLPRRSASPTGAVLMGRPGLSSASSGSSRSFSTTLRRYRTCARARSP